VMARDPEYAQRWLDLYPDLPAPGGEKFADFSRRIQRAIAAIANQADNGCAVVVTHAGVICALLGRVSSVEGTTLDLTRCEYGSCWEVWREAGQWRVSHVPTPDRAQAEAESASAGFEALL
jgi:broad specificity phosphatase PhoE